MCTTPYTLQMCPTHDTLTLQMCTTPYRCALHTTHSPYRCAVHYTLQMCSTDVRHSHDTHTLQMCTKPYRCALQMWDTHTTHTPYRCALNPTDVLYRCETLTPYRCALNPTDVLYRCETLTWGNDELRLRVSCISQFSVPGTQNTHITAHTQITLTLRSVWWWWWYWYQHKPNPVQYRDFFMSVQKSNTTPAAPVPEESTSHILRAIITLPQTSMTLCFGETSI